MLMHDLYVHRDFRCLSDSMGQHKSTQKHRFHAQLDDN